MSDTLFGTYEYQYFNILRHISWVVVSNLLNKSSDQWSVMLFSSKQTRLEAS